MGIVLKIAARETENGNMTALTTADIDKYGLKKDINTSEDRAISILVKKHWEDACEDLNKQLHWHTRRANFLVDGIEIENSQGKKLKIGSVIAEVTNECKPCGLMEEFCEGLFDALSPHWRGGILCKIIKSGTVSENETIERLD